MKFSRTTLQGVTIVELEKHEDDRGSFARIYCPDEFAKAGIDFSPIHINLSRNRYRNTLRGLHFQHPPNEEDKLVRVVKGKIWDVAVDIRKDSPTFCQWYGAELDDNSGRALLVPKGFAHGFLTLEDSTDVLYMASARYSRESEDGARWDDSAFSIRWPAVPKVISARDLGFKPFKS